MTDTSALLLDPNARQLEMAELGDASSVCAEPVKDASVEAQPAARGRARGVTLSRVEHGEFHEDDGDSGSKSGKPAAIPSAMSGAVNPFLKLWLRLLTLVCLLVCFVILPYLYSEIARTTRDVVIDLSSSITINATRCDVVFDASTSGTPTMNIEVGSNLYSGNKLVVSGNNVILERGLDSYAPCYVSFSNLADADLPDVTLILNYAPVESTDGVSPISFGANTLSLSGTSSPVTLPHTTAAKISAVMESGSLTFEGVDAQLDLDTNDGDIIVSTPNAFVADFVQPSGVFCFSAEQVSTDVEYSWGLVEVESNSTLANSTVVDSDSALFSNGTQYEEVIINAVGKSVLCGHAFAVRTKLRWAGKSKGSLDGVVAVAHTEGVMQIVGPETGTPTVNVQMKEPRNKRMVVRTLAGFIVHPNVGAALIIDSQDPDVAVHASDVDEEIKRREEREGKSLLATSRYQVLTLSGDLHSDVSRASKVLEDWIPTLEGMNRTKQPLSKLTIALQCGGSDSFSGVSANPLMGAAARKLIQHGGSAILAETDELMGAEPYILRSTRDYTTAQSFLKTIAWYKSWAAHHGHTAEANPSGGNNFRGLYNIALKSLGAAMKKPKDVSLDYVLDYGEAIGDRNGYFFMNSPGNDLESIAGQVASGSNIVYFSTGNGSITNFPFVPTLKVVTTTTRFRMLENEMDVNAGRYLDGETMDSLSSNLFHQTITAASGTKTRGEAAKHYQVSIWRNWCQDVGDILEFDGSKTIGTPLVPEVPRVEISESPLHVKDFGRKNGDYCFTAWGKDSNGIARTGRIGLVLATSLCSSQASVTMAENLVSKWNLQVPPEVRDFFQSFTALAHTEGCGASSGASEDIFAKIITGHAASPLVSAVCCVEHGCEKTHNDYMIPLLKEKLNQDIPLGCASLQLDGGVQSVTDKSAVANTKTDTEAVRRTCQCNLSNVRVGMTSNVGVAPNVAEALTTVETACAILEAGGTVVVPSTSPLLQSAPFRSDLIRSVVVTPTIGFAQVPTQPGLHVMDCPSSSFLEVITGLGACGTNAILTATPSPSSTHPLVPVFQMWSGSSAKWGRKCPPGAHDLVLEEASGADNAKLIISKLLHVLEGSYVPKAKEGGNVAFQITRGYEGISM